MSCLFVCLAYIIQQVTVWLRMWSKWIKMTVFPFSWNFKVCFLCSTIRLYRSSCLVCRTWDTQNENQCVAVYLLECSQQSGSLLTKVITCLSAKKSTSESLNLYLDIGAFTPEATLQRPPLSYISWPSVTWVFIDVSSPCTVNPTVCWVDTCHPQLNHHSGV